MRTVATAVVQTSRDRVWATLADHEGISSWGPAVTVTLDRSGHEDRNGVGAVRRIAAPGHTIVEEVVAFEPDRLLAYEARSGMPFRNYRGEVTLTPASPGTRIDWAIEADERVPVLEKLVANLIARTLLSRLAHASAKG